MFDAEAEGALEGLEAAASLPHTDRICVCLDNIVTARCLRSTPTDFAQDVVIEL